MLTALRAVIHPTAAWCGTRLYISWTLTKPPAKPEDPYSQGCYKHSPSMITLLRGVGMEVMVLPEQCARLGWGCVQSQYLTGHPTPGICYHAIVHLSLKIS